MIWLFNSKSKVSVSYKNFEEVCDHFQRLEHLKPESEEGLADEERWGFAYWPHKRLSILHEHLDNSLTQAEYEAYQHELDLIEISVGSLGRVEQYAVTPDIDVGMLMREWCFDYAYAHGYTVLETLSNNMSMIASSGIHTTPLNHDVGRFQEGSQP
jgi:hypothetical protein